MSNRIGKDLTSGSIPKNLLYFSIPMLIGNVLNIGYSVINTIWVGKIVGDNAVGATAVSFPIIFLLIAVSSGATIATSILVAQYYGAKKMDMVSTVINNSFFIAIIMGIVLTMIGILSSDFLLKAMNTPPDIFREASSYLKISLLNFIFMHLSFLIASILRGIGDTVTPLIFLGVSTLINAVLDPFLIIGIYPFPKFGLNGAAYASLISVIIAFIISFTYLYRKGHFVTPKFKGFSPDKKIIFLIFKIGFPSIIQQSLVSIGAAFITSFVNSFGASATSAFGAASRIDMVAMMPAQSVMMAVSTMTGQSLGAGKPELIKKIFKWGVILGFSITIIIALAAFIFPDIILRMFLNNQNVIDIGVGYLRVVSIGYVIFTVMFISNGVINGAGATIVTMVFSLISLWVVRVPLAAFLSKTQLGITGIWISITVSFIVTTTISLIYLKSGRWKKASAKIHHAPPTIDIVE
jgi:putative MATE family efflux protein